jgi:hypothetical protein
MEQMEKQQAGKSGETFVHTPRAPKVPEGDAHNWQRWFVGADDGRDVYASESRYGSGYAQVFRDARTDVAEVTVAVRVGPTRFTAEIDFGPAGLRDLAHRLLDAAHDIETHPAAALATSTEEAA